MQRDVAVPLAVGMSGRRGSRPSAWNSRCRLCRLRSGSLVGNDAGGDGRRCVLGFVIGYDADAADRDESSRRIEPATERSWRSSRAARPRDVDLIDGHASDRDPA